MQKKELKKKLCKIDNEEDPLFTIKLRDIVIDCSSEDITQEFFLFLDNNNNSIKLRFAAFYAIYIYYRRYEHHSLLFSLVDKYSNIFNEFQLNDVVLSQYYRLKFLETNDEFAIINAIKFAKRAAENLNDNAGVLQNFAGMVASALEAGREESKEYLMEAIQCMDKAILVFHDYPKHYCTKGRLLSWTGDYESAKKYIRKAIDLESTDSRDSLLRISQYNDYYIDIKMRESLEKLSAHLLDAQVTMNRINEYTQKNSSKIFEKLDTMQARYLELLAFFSAVIALILTSVNLVNNYEDFNAVAGLIMVMGGVLIIGFCALRCLIIFNKDNISWKRYLSVFCVAVLLIGLGYCLGNFQFWRSIWNIK